MPIRSHGHQLRPTTNADKLSGRGKLMTTAMTLQFWGGRGSLPTPGPPLSGVGFLREAREKCLSTGRYLSQVLDFIEMVSGLP